MAVGRKSTHVRTRGRGQNPATHASTAGKPVVRTRGGGRDARHASVAGNPTIRTQSGKSAEQVFDENG